MKEKRILNLLGQVNDDYIAEAAPSKSSKSKHRGVKWGIVAACLCLVLAGVLQLGRKPTLSLSLVMTAYAADGTGYELGETPVALLDDMEIGSGAYATYDEGTGHGRSSSLFHIVCENENIDTITYTINNEVNATNMAELSQNNAWFATQTTTQSPVNDEFPVYATRRSSNGTYAYSYVGNSYTVNYGNQDSTEMYLEYRIDNVNGQWTAKVINITVNVKFKDGSIAEKKLLIQPTYDDSIRELRISVLSEDTEALAEKYLQSAFSFDAKECSPIITQEDDMLSFQYLKDEDDSFTVDFYKGYDFPQTLYHFCHSNEEEQVFIEKNEDFQFNTEMVETAKAFVKKVYGIDCSEADVHAYGYANKVSVQLNVAANVIFQVRFYYKDDVPVGVLFFTEQEYATGAMKANKAALLYSDTAH